MGLPLESLQGKYEIVAKIREGGMGAIYKVRHRLLGEVRVVKVLHAQHDRDEELRRRFLREARAAIRLRHPNVVQIFDFNVDRSGSGLLVMEHIAGIDWRRLIRGGRRPSLSLALEMARQALLALGYLHRNGFVHRDVSPDNLMLALDHDRRPLVKLIDLGIAKNLVGDELTATGSFLGKFRYSSPEHFGSTGPTGSGGVGPHSDLYTFGLVLYELLTGHYAMAADDTSQLISAHLFQPPRDFAETDPDGRLPEEVRGMLLRSLQKDPADRYPDTDSWLADLEMLCALFSAGAELAGEARHWLHEADAEDPDTWTPGSTQSKLDRNFGLEKTPAPIDEDTRTVGEAPITQIAAARGPATRGPATRGPATRGPADRGAADRGAADRGAADRGAAELDGPPAEGPPAAAGGASKAPPADASGEDFETLFESGVKSVLLRDYDRARVSFEAARRLRPEDSRVGYNLDRLRRRIEDP